MTMNKPPRLLTILMLVLLLLLGTATSALARQNEPAAQVPFETELRLAVIKVRVNDTRELRCILDTGMPEGLFLFDPALGTELGLEYVGQAQVRGVGPASKTASIAMGATLEVGPVELTNQRVIVMSEREDLVGGLVDGVVGASIFSQHVVELDFEREMITLFDPATFDDTAAGVALPLTISRTRPYVELLVSVDDGEAVPITVVVDTGAGTNLSINESDDDALSPPDRVIHGLLSTGVGGDVHGVVGRVSTLRLGEHTLNGVVTRFPKDGMADESGTLGMGSLRRFVVTFDYVNERMLLRRGERFGDAFEHNMAGLALRPAGEGRYRVDDVVEESPGASAGLRKGDVILAVDGRPIDEIGSDQIENAFTRAGEAIIVTVDREGERIDVALELRRLI